MAKKRSTHNLGLIRSYRLRKSLQEIAKEMPKDTRLVDAIRKANQVCRFSFLLAMWNEEGKPVN